MPKGELLHMVYALQCLECGSDDSWCIEINGPKQQWDKILGFECQCGHYLKIAPLTVKEKE